MPKRTSDRKDSSISQHKETITPSKGSNAVKIESAITATGKKPTTPIAKESTQVPP
jgi:hypothetical protein